MYSSLPLSPDPGRSCFTPWSSQWEAEIVTIFFYIYSKYCRSVQCRWEEEASASAHCIFSLVLPRTPSRAGFNVLLIAGGGGHSTTQNAFRKNTCFLLWHNVCSGASEAALCFLQLCSNSRATEKVCKF